MGDPSSDHQTLLVRRAIALGGLVILILLLFFVLRSCASTRKENALKDYNHEVASIVGESDSQIGAPFFELLGQAGDESPQDLQTNISGYRVASENLLKQARKLDVPGEMKPAQQALLIALEFRRDGLGFIAERIRTALGDEGDAANKAITEIAGEMQMFMASDVLYEARTKRFITHALDEAEIGGQKIAASRFLPGIEWLSEQTVASQLGQTLSSGGSGSNSKTPAPGLHGTGIEGVSIGDTTLQPDAPNRVTAKADTPIVVKFTNQGENDEFDVKVTVTVEGGDKPIKASRTVDTVAKGQTAEASLTLGKAPPTGAAVTVKATVAKVPGEQKTDNNTSEYDVLFTAG
jgi:hypothetical protein